jgi:hypothetical protein
MARITDSILGKDKAYGGHSGTMDLSRGGMGGYLPHIGVVGADGKSYDAWISNHAYVKRNIIPIVMSYPKFFDLMPDKDKWIESYKALIELQTLTIDGLSSGLTAEFDEHPVGSAGEMQEELTKVTRARSTLAMTWKEKAGKSIQKFFDFYMRYGMLDPDANKPLVTKYIDDMEKIGGMYTPDFYTGTVLFIEPDVTHKVVVDAWLCTNVSPKGNGDRTGKRDIKTAGEVPEIAVEFTSITMNNEAVLVLGDKILKSLTVINKLPDTDMVLPIQEVEASLAGKAGFNG